MSAGSLIETRPRISQVLFEMPDRSFGSIASFASNIRAVDTALLFANGLHSSVALVGPSGWGKTHILDAVAVHIERETNQTPKVHSAVDWISQGRAEIQGALLLDNVQDALESARSRQLLRVALERRVRSGRRTMLAFTGHRPTRQLRSYLPSSKDWVVAHVPAPDLAERFLVVDQMARAEKLKLGRALVKVFADRIKGNGRTLSGALKRLKLHGKIWSDEVQTLHACGLLDPFFVDSSDWDLAEHVLRTAEYPEFRKTKVNQRDMAIYTLLKVAELPEAKVARTFGVQPAEAFYTANRFEEMLSQNQEAQGVQSEFIGRVVATL